MVVAPAVSAAVAATGTYYTFLTKAIIVKFVFLENELHYDTIYMLLIYL